MTEENIKQKVKQLEAIKADTAEGTDLKFSRLYAEIGEATFPNKEYKHYNCESYQILKYRAECVWPTITMPLDERKDRTIIFLVLSMHHKNCCNKK